MTSSRHIKLGQVVGVQRTLALTDEQRLETHMHVIGASRTGKSKFLENLIRQDIEKGNGVCLIDPHGSLAEKILAWTSQLRIPPKRFHYIAPWRDDWTVCYNPLYKDPNQRRDDWFLINAMKLATVKVWGGDDTQQTPRLDEWLRNSFYVAVTLGLTLPEVAMLLEPTVERNAQRRAIVERLPETATRIRSAYLDLCELAEKKKSIEFEARVGSTLRRLAAFLDNPRLHRIFGVPDVSIDLAACMDEGAVIIVDLSPKGQFHYQDANLFGTLLLTDFYVQMFNRKRTSRPFFLYIDEFQNFATKDIARMLDESLKFGLSMCLAHQRPGQLQNSDSAEERDIYSAVMTNARNKVVFGGVGPEELKPVAELLSMGHLDPNKIKNEIWTKSVVAYEKQYWQAHSRGVSHTTSSASGGSSGFGTMSASGSAGGMSYTTGPEPGSFSPQALHTTESSNWSHSFGSSDFSGSSWMDGYSDSESDSTTTFPVLVPILGKQLSTIYYEGLDEQLYQFMTILYDQEQRHAMTRLLGQEGPLPIIAPFVSDPVARPEHIERQLQMGYENTSFFLQVNKAVELVEHRQTEFLALGKPEPRQAPDVHATMEVQPSMTDTSLSTAPTTKVGNMELQERDIAILKDVFDTRFITIEHAADLHFQDLKSAAASAKRRLSKLAENGLLKPQDVPLKRAKKVYRLTKQGLDILIERGILRQLAGEEWDAKLRKRYTDTISPAILEHEIGMLDIKVAVNAAIAEQAHLKVIDFGIWPLQYKFPVQRDGRTVDQHPDGFLHIAEFRPNEDHPRNHYFYVELDRGTEPLDTVAQKADGYRQHLRDGGFGQAIGRPDAPKKDRTFRVLFVVDTKDAGQRRRNICQRLADDGIQTHALVATLAEVRKDPLSAIWLTPQAHKAWIESGGKQAPQKEPLFGD